MNKMKFKSVLNVITFFCSLLVIITSASALNDNLNNALLLGVIAGSFGAGATLANIIRDFRARRDN